MLDAYPSRALGWVAYFESNASREARLPLHSPRANQLPPALKLALVRTLQRFHLGESGEGEYLKRFAATTGDEAYCHAIDLSITEEQTHSRWFGMLLERLEAPALTKHWSDVIFTKVRRAGGLHFELMTFLTAEIVGQKFFAQLARFCPDSVSTAVFAQVVRDESAHIAFHIGTLRLAFTGQTPTQRLLWHFRWKVMLACAIAIVCIDQASIFRELRLSRREFTNQCFETFEVISKRIWAKSHHAPSMLAPKTSAAPTK